MASKKASNRHSLRVLYLNLTLIFGFVAPAYAFDSDAPHGNAQIKKTNEGNDDPCANTAAITGALIGAVGGIVLRNIFNIKEGNNAIAAGIGGVVGGLIGHEIDKRRCELSKIAKNHQLELETAEITKNDIANEPENTASSNGMNFPAAQRNEKDSVGLSVIVIDKAGSQFQSDSDRLTPEAEAAFRDIAKQYAAKITVDQEVATIPQNDPNRMQKIEAIKKNFSSRRIFLIGHTDDTGDSKKNADLSERRARSVATLFQSEGIPLGNIYYQGAGETLPIADNHDETGRAKNRRVEIVDVSDGENFDSYIASRKPNVAYYRAAENIGADSGAKQSASQVVAEASRENLAVAPIVNGSASVTTQNHKSKTAVITASVKKNTAAVLDFGGEISNGPFPKLDIGSGGKEGGYSFNLIKSAQAADVVSASCLNDRPRVANLVKALSNGSAYKTTDYLPGLNNGAWYGTVNGHAVALTNVAVLKGGATPANNPNLLIYKDMDKNSSAARKADFNQPVGVSVYKGSKGVLYRVFSEGPVRCIDMVIPNGNTMATSGSWLYYAKEGQIYRAAYPAQIAR